MVSLCKLGGTINQTGVEGGKSKGLKYHRSLFSFPFSPRQRFSRLDLRHVRLPTTKNERSIKGIRNWIELGIEKVFQSQLNTHEATLAPNILQSKLINVAKTNTMPFLEIYLRHKISLSTS